MIELNQLPPMDEVWKVGNQLYVVRYVDRTSPPVPLVWRLTEDQYEAVGSPKITRVLSPDQFTKTGALPQGGALEIWGRTKTDPLEILYDNYAAEVRVKPYLADPEILAAWTAAVLERRDITDAEIQNSEWWRTHTETERQWLVLNVADPVTADALIADNRTRVADLFSQAGIDNATDQLIQTVADQWTQGAWSEVHAVNQIRLLADPILKGTLDPMLRGLRGGLDTTRAGEDEVRDLINRWVGPAIAAGWSENQTGIWASRMRENPDARVELEELLRGQRLALYPAYENPNLTYEDIAAPWRGVWQQMWGQVPDEADPLFMSLVQLNDLGAARKLLRTEGRKRGNPTVVGDLLSDLGEAFGGQVRRADPAVL